jgi:hypothetical protein
MASERNEWGVGVASATERLHCAVIVHYLFVADKAALETGKVLVVFVDDCGRVVRQARIRPGFCEDTAGAWHDCHISDSLKFKRRTLGQTI